MSQFDRPLVGYRLADILYGDTLQAIAYRELGTATRWVDIANINDLLPPYLTDDPALASDRVLLSGGVIVIPATTKINPLGTGSDPDALYGTDLDLSSGGLAAENGDFVVNDGRANLRQGLSMRVVVERGELAFHPDYGCLVRTLVGAVVGPTATLLAAQYVKSTLRIDPRVKSVISVEAEAVGSQIAVTATVLPIIGQSAKIETVI